MTTNAEQGAKRIRWAESYMPVLRALRAELTAEQPFAGKTIGICLHIEPKTAVMCGVLRAAGAALALTGSPGTTQDDVVASLRETGTVVYGSRSDRVADHDGNIRSVLSHRPHLLLDNGASLVQTLLNSSEPHNVTGGTEETTTGANLLREEMKGKIHFPVIVINDSPLKVIMENEHGVGPTVVAAFLSTTNLMVPGRRFAVFGYGSVGRGIARYLHALHARVTVVEPDPIRALEAALDGLQMASCDAALANNQVLITATGRANAITAERFGLISDGAILANAGHYSWEIDLTALRDAAQRSDRVNASTEVFTMRDGKRISLLAGGEMLNLAAGGGNPVETMDLGLALQVLSLRLIAQRARELPPGPQPVPMEINRQVARAMLEALSR
jgi:adenosylhomocysteinase